MLAGDRRLVERDPRVMGLATVLDDATLTRWLRDQWPPGAAPPEHARVTYLRYKPGTLVLATARVGFGETTSTALVAAAAPDSLAKLDKIARWASSHPGDLPLITDHERCLAFAPLTGDRHLPGIHRLADRLRWIDRRLTGARLEVLSYKPHRRLVVRADVDGTPRAVAKLHAPHAYHQVASALDWAGGARSRRLVLPRTIGSDPDHGLVVTEWLPGSALDDREPDRRRATLRDVGKLVGRLHAADPAGLGPSARVTADPHSILAAIGRLLPELVPTARRALDEGAPAGAPTAPVHGDLSPDQVVHGPGGVGLIDLDRAGLGHPANDLASWIAAEHLIGVVSGESPDRLLPAPLSEGYRGVGGPATDEQIAGQVPLELLRRASDPFRMRMHDWPERMAAIIEAAGAGDAVRVPS